MARVIEFDLSTQGINQALKEVKEMQQWVERKKTELRRRLAEIGMEEANIQFAAATYAGTNDVTVRMEWGTDSATVIADGKAVAFIEFGSGVARGRGYPGDKPSGTAAIGTYGQGRGSSGKGWIYEGPSGTSGHPVPNKPGLNWTRGNPPNAAMYKAAREIERQFVAIAREVFST